MASVTVVTPTIPQRAHLLADAIASVAAQTVPCEAHLIAVDVRREGPAAVRNRLACRVDTDWLAFLDDDDVMLPHHLETLLAHADAEVVYSRCDPSYRTVWDLWRPFDPDRLEQANFIPVTALVATSAFWAAGGFDPADDLEDWGLWRRMAADGCRFVGVDAVTWAYRAGGWPRRTDDMERKARHG